MSSVAPTPRPPYYAVIFTSIHTTGENAYEETAQRMLQLAAQQQGRTIWYEAYKTRIAKVERDYQWIRE